MSPGQQNDLTQRLTMLGQAARRRRHAFPLGVALGDEAADFLYVEHELLVEDEVLDEALARLGERHVHGQARPTPLAGLSVLRIDADVMAGLEVVENGVGPGRASPHHVACVAGFTPSGLIPSVGPATGGRAWPARQDVRGVGRSRVVVLDTGFLPDSAREHRWLDGVRGDDDPAGQDPPPPDSPAWLFTGHGTFLAGVVRALAGPRCDVWVDGVLAGGLAGEVSLMAALRDALVDREADVVLVGGGWYTFENRPPLTMAAAARSVDAGRGDPFVVVAAAGNDGSPTPCWPAAQPEVLAVGALTRDGERATWSNHGGWVDLYAPGVGIVNAYLEGSQESPNGERREYRSLAEMAGTSVAAAVACGELAAEVVAGDTDPPTAAAAVLAAARRTAFTGGGRPRLFVPPPLGGAVSPVAADAVDTGWWEAEPREATFGFEGRREPSAVEPPGTQPAAAETAGSPAPPEPTRTAYARLDAPSAVAPGDVFELRVGLATSPSPAVQSQVLMVPTEPFRLDVQLLADGFTVLGGDRTEVSIDVSPQDPFPYRVLRLSAREDPALAPARSVVAVFHVDGRFLGVASRVVTVSARPPQRTEAPAEQEPAAGVDWALPADEASRPDLEVVIAGGNDAAGELRTWFFRSRHSFVPATAPVTRSVGPDVAGFARQTVMRAVEDRKNSEGLVDYLNGIADVLGEAVPGQLWETLSAIATAQRRPPTVLLATSDPFIPWELAAPPHPWDEQAPAFLGAQAAVGRWIYSEQTRSPAPPDRIEARRMAVVAGQYPGNQRLPEAEEEARLFRQTYGAEPVEPLFGAVKAAVKDADTAQIAHFAVHGKLDQSGTRDGILLVDGQYLDPISIRGWGSTGVRIVFLNACQLGQSQQVLGEYAGMVPAFLRLGCGAAVAPLWKVDDAVARDIAVDFYAEVLGENPRSPADQLRRERARTKDEAGPPVSTRLAYAFFGHPLLRVTWRRDEGNGHGG